jgi:glycerophosphoryl diester phosphodiesterase
LVLLFPILDGRAYSGVAKSPISKQITACLVAPRLKLFGPDSWDSYFAHRSMNRPLLATFLRRWRELAGFALLFRLIESVLLAPAAAWAGKWLLGRTVLDSTAILSFLLSPRGIAALLLAGVGALTLRLVEHAGLAAIFFGGLEGRRISSRQALCLIWQRLPVFIRVAARFIWVGLVVIVPLLLVAGGIAAGLFRQHDVNYYLKFRPPEFITAVIVIGVVALLTMAVIVWLVLRWRWAMQAVLFQHLGFREAFVESATLTKGVRWRLLLLVVGVTLFAAGMGALASLLGSICTSVVLAVAAHGMTSLAVSFGILLTLRAILGAVFTFLGSCADAGLFTWYYRQRVGQVGVKVSLNLAEDAPEATPPRWVPAFLVGGLLVMAAGGTWLALEAIPVERPITVHAHRGVASRAPENTLAALRDAIAAGADFMETDVQLSKDNVLVIAHDSDFSRLGGVPKKVWDLNYAEICAIPLGGRSAPEFRTESTPSLDALLAEAKGRIRLNLELKYYGDHQPGLAGKVVEAVRARGMLNQVVIQCLEYDPLLEVRRLAPEVPIGYLLSVNAREPKRLQVDFFSVEQNRLDRAFIQQAHRRGQQVYAWTVDSVDDMDHMLNLDIDGLITDESARARKQIDLFLNCPPSERAVRRVRAWLSD